LDSTKPAFEQLTASCLQRKLPVDVWRSAENLAMQERGDRLKFFDVKHKKAPTLAQITLGLIDSKDDSKYPANVVDWISDGIKAENDQWVSIYEDFTLLHRFHVDSMWSPHGFVESMWSPCGVHADFPLKTDQFYEICVESIWTPHGLHVDSMWTMLSPWTPPI
jgi:hypothetical protein